MESVYLVDDADVPPDSLVMHVKSLSVRWFAAVTACSRAVYVCAEPVSRGRNVMCMLIGVKSPTVAAMVDVAMRAYVTVRVDGREKGANCVPVPTLHAQIMEYA